MKITWIGSPNFDTTRKPIKKIIIHWMAGSLAGTDTRFKDPKSKVSAHYGIEDNNIHQYVKEENTAWHAGVYSVNQESIGIEHSADPERPASEKTYQTSGELVADVCKRYNIPLDREHILKHLQIKATLCPGTVDLDKIIQLAKGSIMPSDQVTISKTEYGQLNEAKTYFQQFKDAGFFSAIEVKQKIDDLNKALEDKNNDIASERGRAEQYRKDYNDLLAYCAKALNTQQERNQVQIGLDKISDQLDELDELQKNYASLQLSAGKTEEELRAEIAKLKALLAQKNVLANVELADLIRELIRRLTNLLKRK